MNEREDWDVIGKYVDAVIEDCEAGVGAYDLTDCKQIADLGLFIVRSLANVKHPAANAAWKALADEREKRERGTR